MNRLVLLAAFIVTVGCQEGTKPNLLPSSFKADAGIEPVPVKAPKNQPLYDRMGGLAGMTKIADAFLTSKKLPTAFQAKVKDDPVYMKKALVTHLANLSGGQVRYTSDMTKTAHLEVGIQSEELAGLLDELDVACVAAQIPESERREFVTLLRNLAK